MKKNIIVLLLMAVAFSGCQNTSNIQIGDPMTMINNQQTTSIFFNSLSVFRTSDTYTVVVEKSGKVQKIAEFFSDRKCRTVQGLVLVKNKEINRYLYKSLNELEEELGEVHVNIGSGFCIPAYITEDGYLIYFSLIDDIVCEVTKQDLLIDEMVECVPQ